MRHFTSAVLLFLKKKTKYIFKFLQGFVLNFAIKEVNFWQKSEAGTLEGFVVPNIHLEKK